MISELHGWINLKDSWINAFMITLPGISALIETKGRTDIYLVAGHVIPVKMPMQQVVETINARRAPMPQVPTPFTPFPQTPPPNGHDRPPPLDGKAYSAFENKLWAENVQADSQRDAAVQARNQKLGLASEAPVDWAARRAEFQPEIDGIARSQQARLERERLAKEKQ
jgi:hypothetical protein